MHVPNATLRPVDPFDMRILSMRLPPAAGALLDEGNETPKGRDRHWVHGPATLRRQMTLL